MRMSAAGICRPGFLTRAARSLRAASRCTRLTHRARHWCRVHRTWAVSQECKVRLRWLLWVILPWGSLSHRGARKEDMPLPPRLLKRHRSRSRRGRIQAINILTSLYTQITRCIISIISTHSNRSPIQNISSIMCRNARLLATCAMTGSTNMDTNIPNTSRITCQPPRPKWPELASPSKPS
jgi:hypothetical protein